MLADLREEAAKFYKDYDEAVEQRVMAAMMEYTYRNINVNYIPDCLKNADRKYRGDFTSLVAHLFSRSIFANQKAFEEYLKNPSLKQLDRDEIYKYGSDILDKYREVYLSIPKENRDNLTRGQRDFVDGILQINAGRKLMSPDANSTIRLTYGNVKAYEPRDGVTYHFYTTLEGVMEKEIPKIIELM